MKQFKYILFSCSLIFWIGIVQTASVVFADEGIGGQVSTTGKISFYEEVTETSRSDATKSNEEIATKPEGKFPSTGEKVFNYKWLGHTLIVVSLFLLFLRKYRQEEQK